MHLSDMGEEEGTTMCTRRRRKISGGRKREQLLPEKREHKAGSGKDSGKHNVSSKKTKSNFHPSSQLK